MCVVYLIASAGVKMLRGLEKNVLSYVIMAVVLVVMTAFSITAVSFSSIFYILISGAVGWLVYMLGRLGKKNGASSQGKEAHKDDIHLAFLKFPYDRCGVVRRRLRDDFAGA